MFLQKALTAVVAGASLLASSVSGYSIERKPVSLVSKVEDAVIHTQLHQIHALRSFELSFYLEHHDQKVRLSLQPNLDILASDASIQHLRANGSVDTVEAVTRHEYRIYKGDAFIRLPGHSEWTNAGWARITLRRDGDLPIFEGTFRLEGIHYHVQTNTRYLQTRVEGDPDIEDSADEYMVVWRDADITESGFYIDEFQDELRRRSESHETTCGSDELTFDDETTTETSPNVVNARNLFGRQIFDSPPGGPGAGVNLTSTIGSTVGCLGSRRVALIGVATDCSYRGRFSSKAAMIENVISQINIASQLYESTFNISFGIQNLTNMELDCPASPPAAAPWNQACSAGGSANPVTISDRLDLFSKWRGDNNDNNAFWTLLTDCGTGPAVGLAWPGQVCQQGSRSQGNGTSAGANVVVHTGSEWQVFAHEAGHTFGAVHDCIDSSCLDGTVTKQGCCPLSAGTCNANAQFIMNPSTGKNITKFSPCSVGNICTFLGRNSKQTLCLNNNKNVVTITPSECGNGIVESGEECDCGGEVGCKSNPCCDAKTCKFTTNSVCDPANEDCCTSQCRFASTGQVCRPSSGQCDPQETCTGTSGSCPADATAPDGNSCGNSNDGLACASGQCTSRNLQCKTFTGSQMNNNLTASCGGSDQCTLLCSSPEFGSTCYTTSQNVLDGTPCDGGGMCRNGSCEGSSWTKRAWEWIQHNLAIFIPVVVVVGLLVLLAFGTCLCNCCCRRRPRRAPKSAPPPGWNQYATAPPPPPMVPAMRGARGGPPRHPDTGFQSPPPTYAPQGQESYQWQQPPPQQQHYQQQGRQNSFRYA